MKDRYELHKFFNEYFPNSKQFLMDIFDVELDEILEEAEKLKGYKIPVKFREKPEIVELSGLNDTVFYNAFLEVLLKKYDRKEIKKELQQWKERSILQFV